MVSPCGFGPVCNIFGTFLNVVELWNYRECLKNIQLEITTCCWERKIYDPTNTPITVTKLCYQGYSWIRSQKVIHPPKKVCFVIKFDTSLQFNYGWNICFSDKLTHNTLTLTEESLSDRFIESNKTYWNWKHVKSN